MEAKEKVNSKENIKNNTNKNKIITILLILTIFLLILSLFMPAFGTREIATSLSNMRIERYKGEDYYIITGDYKGEYEIANYSIDRNNLNRPKDVKAVLTYDEYVDFCIARNIDVNYTDASKNYIVFSYSKAHTIRARLAEVQQLGKTVALYVWDSATTRYMPPLPTAYAIIIPTTISTKTIVNVVPMYSEDQFDDMTTVIDLPIFNPGDAVVYKPVIYLYPTEDTKVDVRLLNDSLITCSYPKYTNGWSVLAKPNGDLTYLSTGRSLYSLYYESNNIVDFKVTNEGFIVKGEDAISFLEEKLEILGLNEHEAEEFIIYWLPKLEANEYNYIRFATKEEIDSNMPLEVSPNPDSIIRVLMTYKGLKSPISVKEQTLERPNRDGFVLVEWGGTEIK